MPRPRRAQRLRFPNFKRESEGRGVCGKEEFKREHCGTTGRPPQHRDALGETHAPHRGRDASVLSHWRNLPETLHRRVTRRRSPVTKRTTASPGRAAGPCTPGPGTGKSHAPRSRPWRPRPTLQDAEPGRRSSATARHRGAARTPGARAGDLPSSAEPGPAPEAPGRLSRSALPSRPPPRPVGTGFPRRPL